MSPLREISEINFGCLLYLFRNSDIDSAIQRRLDDFWSQPLIDPSPEITVIFFLYKFYFRLLENDERRP